MTPISLNKSHSSHVYGAMTLNPLNRSDSRRAKTHCQRLILVVEWKAKYSLVTEERLGRLLMDEMEEIYFDEERWRDPEV